MKYVYKSEHAKRYRFPTHANDLIIDRGDCTTSEVFLVTLLPNEAPPLHKHDDTEQIFFVLEGQGRLRIGSPPEEHEVLAGDTVRIPPGTLHSIQAGPERSLRYLAVDCFVGSKPAAEPTWDDHVKVVCKQNDWDYNKVVSGGK